MTDSLDKIRSIPIIDIYNQYVGGKLTIRGRQVWARCQWHGSDSSPSLKIYPSQNSWWCYGCNAGGSQIDMVVHALKLTVGDAIRKIQRDFNINGTPDRHIKERQIKRNINEMFEENFNHVFTALANLNKQLIKSSRNIRIIVRYPSIFMYQLIIDDILENMCSTSQEEQIIAWRKAKKVFPWI